MDVPVEKNDVKDDNIVEHFVEELVKVCTKYQNLPDARRTAISDTVTKYTAKLLMDIPVATVVQQDNSDVYQQGYNEGMEHALTMVESVQRDKNTIRRIIEVLDGNNRFGSSTEG